MSKISKTAAASMKGGPAEIKKDPFDTNEKKIKELRNQRRDHLAVGRYDFIDALIEEYDKVQLLLVQEIANVVVAQAAAEAAIEAHAATQKINVTLLNVNEKLNGELNAVILQRDEARRQSVMSVMEAAVADSEMMATDVMTSEGGNEPAQEN